MQKQNAMERVEYRKIKGSYTWHWCKNCSNWPALHFDCKFTKPTVGEFCAECKANELLSKHCKTN